MEDDVKPDAEKETSSAPLEFDTQLLNVETDREVVFQRKCQLVVLNGAAKGKKLDLNRPVTKIGKHGMQIGTDSYKTKTLARAALKAAPECKGTMTTAAPKTTKPKPKY